MTMSDERKRSVDPWIAGIALTALLSLYVGAYFWLVLPLRFGSLHTGPIAPAYRIPLASQGIAGALFAPIHALDRRIRPHVWEP
jgi:hypothetical protein